MDKDKSFINIGIIYAAGQFLSKALAFVFIPIYIQKLGIDGYGQLALVDTVSDFISVFIMLGVYSGYIRFYREYENKNRLKNTAINFAIVMSIIDIFIVLALGKIISVNFLEISNSYYVLLLVVIKNILIQFIILLMCDYSLNYEAFKTVSINIVNLILSMIFILLFVVVYKQGVLGVYKGYVISNFVIFIYLALCNYKNYRIEIDIKMLKNMLMFSIGFIPSCLSATVLTLSDRYFLKGYRSYSEVGVYSLGYKVGMLIEPLFVSPFRQVFTPYKFKLFKENDAVDRFNYMFIKYHVIGCFVILGISIYSKLLIMLLSKGEYMEAYKIVPFVIFSYFLYGKAIFYSLGIEIKNRTYLDGLIMLISGVLNMLLNIIFVRKYGMYGAAFATMISYIFMNFLYLKFSLPLYYVKYNFKDVFKIYGITMGLYVIYYFFSILKINMIIEFVIGVFLLLGYILLCIMLNLIQKQELNNYIIIIIKKFKEQKTINI